MYSIIEKIREFIAYLCVCIAYYATKKYVFTLRKKRNKNYKKFCKGERDDFR